jgi:hypothetical protein
MRKFIRGRDIYEPSNRTKNKDRMQDDFMPAVCDDNRTFDPVAMDTTSIYKLQYQHK